MVAADQLITERLAEFQQRAQQKGTLPKGTLPAEGDTFSPPSQQAATGTAAAISAGAKLLGKGSADPALPVFASKGAFMKEFFEQVSEINSVLAKGRSNVKSMGEVLEDALQATTPERQKQVSDRLYEIVRDTNGKIHAVKDALEELRRRTEALDSEDEKEREIRTNMQNQMSKKHCQLLVDFQKAQEDFKAALKQRQAREIRMVLPEAPDEEVQEMLDSGQSLSLVVAQKMAGTHHMLIDEVNRIAEKHQDIQRLQNSVNDLAEMFQEMAVLVDAQGEMLDAIECHVHKAKVCTEKAEENLITTRKAQHSAQRWMCCLAVVMLIILVAILLPVITAA